MADTPKHSDERPKDGTPGDRQSQEPLDPKQQAIKYKAFRHTFSERDVRAGLNDKRVLRKLKKSQKLQESYENYLESLKKDPSRRMVFPWDNPFRRILFFCRFYAPRIFKWGIFVCLLLLIVNYIPGPTQHAVELIVARTLYDTARDIERLPLDLETYAHSAKIVDSRGRVIKSYGKRRVTQAIPEPAKKALLACEDHYLLPHPNNPWYVNAFLIHAGVSWFNLAGAVKDTLLGNTRGASTIVMQNAKKILGNRERTIANKLEEIIIAYMMVSRFGKEKNLDFYINTVPVGANIYGFPAAARNYFKKDLAELNMQQLVTIASFIPNHNRQIAFYKVVRGESLDELDSSLQGHAKSAMNKVNLALAYLRDLGEISDEQYRSWRLVDEESIRRIGFRDFRSPLYGEEEWTSWNVIREVCSRSYRIGDRTASGAQLLLDERGDVVIETGVELELVERIKEIITEFLASRHFRQVLRQRNRHGWQEDLALYRSRGIEPPYTDFEGFMEYLYRHINVGVIIVNRRGEIIAYVGGKEFFQGGGDDLDADGGESDSEQRVIIDLMNRQATITPASTIKPVIAYYAMVQTNATLESEYADRPVEYKYVESLGREVWLPRNWYNYDAPGQGTNRYLGRKYSLLEAQVLSVNTIFARLYTNRIVQNAMLLDFDEIGLDYNREDAKYWPFGIGASDVPVQQWLGVYNAFLDGSYREPAFVRRILVNGEPIYDRRQDPEKRPIPLFDSKPEREEEMVALYEVCNRGTGAAMAEEFKYHKNLVSGKTGTAPQGQTSLFVSHFNPYNDRPAHPFDTMTMLVAVTTNTGGHKNVGTSTQGPVVVAGRIYDYLFEKGLRTMMDSRIEAAKRSDAQLRNNHLYWANINRYMERLLNDRCGDEYIYENIIGVDGFEEALSQILNSDNQIYAGRDQLFGQLVDYYCDEGRVVKMAPAAGETVLASPKKVPVGE